MQTRTFPCSAASVCPVLRRPHVCRRLRPQRRRRLALSVRRFSHLQAPRTVRCSNICWSSCTTLRRAARSADNAVPPIPSLIVPNHRRRCSSVKIIFTMTKLKKMEKRQKNMQEQDALNKMIFNFFFKCLLLLWDRYTLHTYTYYYITKPEDLFLRARKPLKIIDCDLKI